MVVMSKEMVREKKKESEKINNYTIEKGKYGVGEKKEVVMAKKKYLGERNPVLEIT